MRKIKIGLIFLFSIFLFACECTESLDISANKDEVAEREIKKHLAEIVSQLENQGIKEYILDNVVIHSLSDKRSISQIDFSKKDDWINIPTYKEFKESHSKQNSNGDGFDANIYSAYLEKYDDDRLKNRKNKGLSIGGELIFALKRSLELTPQFYENRSLAEFRSVLFDDKITMIRHGGEWKIFIGHYDI